MQSVKKETCWQFLGHDHKNSFIGKYKNVIMGFTPSAGFNEYGNGINRGVRVIELDENDINNFSTRVVTYGDLGFKKLKKPVKDFLFRHFPASTDAAVILIRNIVIFIISIAVILSLIL